MENRSNPPTEFLLTMLFFVGAIVASVVAVGRGQDGKAHQNVMMTFWQLHVDQASLQRDILQIRAGLLTNYDPLVGSVVNLHRDVEALKHLIDAANLDDSQSLRKHIGELNNSIDAEEQSVEEFKTRNALLVNSYRIFVHLLTTGFASEPAIDEPGHDSLDGLGNLMMRFADEPKADLASRLRLKFSALMRADDERYHALSRHGQMILITRPMVDAALAGVQESAVPQLIKHIEQTYVEAYVRADMFANKAKIVLAVIAFALCGLVAILLGRLRARSQRLAEQLAFEKAAGLAKGRLANAEPDGFDEAMQAALAIFSAFFKARIGLRIVDRCSDDQVELYEHTENNHPSPKAIWQTALQHLRQGDRVETALPAFFVADEDGTESGHIAILAALPGKLPLIAVCLVIYDQPAPQLTKVHKAQLRAAIDVMTDAVRLNWTRRDRAALEQRLEHAKRLEAIGTLAGGIAHEFNNCIGALLGYGEMLRQSMRRRSKASTYAREIVGICHRAMTTVDQILSFSRKRNRDGRPFDLYQVVADCAANLRISLSPDFEIDLVTKEDRFVIRGHPVEVQQIVTNLCRNASEAMPQDRRCIVRLERHETGVVKALSHGELPIGSHAKLSVQDRGPGIPPHLLAHLFEPFFTTKGHRGGTGLGLAVVHGSVSALSAQIDVKTGLGQGTRFDVYFPLVEDCPMPMEVFFQEEAIPRGHGELVAIIDADEERRTDCEDCVAAFGYEPVGFRAAADVLEWCQNLGQPEFLLVDLATCSDEDCCRLKNALADVPIVLIGENGKDDARGDDVVLRPLDVRSFAELLHNKLEPKSGPFGKDDDLPQTERL